MKPGADDRVTCDQCFNHRGGCLAWKALGAVRGYAPIPDLPRRCAQFAPRRVDPDQRSATERWPGLFNERNQCGEMDGRLVGARV